MQFARGLKLLWAVNMYYFEAGVNSDCLLSNSITQVQEIICPLGVVFVTFYIECKIGCL